MADINPVALAKSEELVPQITISETGVATLPKDAFIDTLKDVTKDDVKRVFAERDTFVAGAIHALGQVAVPAMANDKTLDQVTLKTSVMSDVVNVGILRSRASMNPQTREVTHAPAVAVAYKAQAAKTNVGMTGSVVAAIKVDAAAKFKD